MNIDGILELLANPFVAALLGTFLGPLLAGIPGFAGLLKFAAGIAGYDLVPKVKPKQSFVTAVDDKGKKIRVPVGQSGGLLDGLDLQKILPFLLIGGMVFLMMSQGGGCKPKPVPEPLKPVSGASITIPAADLQSLVAPVRSLAATKPDAAKALAPYWSAGADVLRRDSSLVATTGQARQAKIDADALYLQKTPLVGSLPGLSVATDAVLSQSVGLEDKPLDAVTRARLADTFDAISWALSQGA